MNANMAQCKLPKDVFALAEAFLEVFVIGNKPYHLVANTETSPSVFVLIWWHPFTQMWFIEGLQQSPYVWLG